MAFHKSQTLGEIHQIHQWSVADNTALLALAPVAADIGKVARQVSDNTFWLLVSQGPNVWKDITISTALVADGDKGDITVSGTGTVWTIDGGVITFAKIATAAVDNDALLVANSATKLPTQQAVKSYVDSYIQGLSWKKAVRVATTVNGALTTAYVNGATLNGIVLATGDRILIKDQTTGSENGLYTVNASGAPTRVTDADVGAELVNATCYVSEGTTLSDTQWTCSTNSPITLGTTALTFVQLSAGGGGGLTNILETLFTAAPNNAVNTEQLQVTNGTTNVSLNLAPKALGAFYLGPAANNGATGGNIRGSNAIDLQIERTAAAQVASGDSSFIAGKDNTASALYSYAIGYNNNVSNYYAIALGRSNVISSQRGTALGFNNSVQGTGASALGENNTASGANAITVGNTNTANSTNALAFGKSASTLTAPHCRAFASGQISIVGDAQVRDAVLCLAIGGVGPANLEIENTAGTYFTIPDKYAVNFTIDVVAQLTTGEMKTWQVTGGCKRTGGTLSFPAAATITIGINETAISAASIAVTADNTNKRIQVAYTGPASTTSYVSAHIRQVEIKIP